jgi:hypothetical protein
MTPKHYSPIQLFKMISQIIPIFQEDNWNEQCQIFSDNNNEKLDREELEPRKEALDDKLKKENQILKFTSLLESVRKSQNILWTLSYLANLLCW